MRTTSPGFANLAAPDGTDRPETDEADDGAGAGGGLARSLAAAPAPLVAPYVFGTTTVAIGEDLPEDAEDDPWAGLKDITPGARDHDLAEADAPEDRGSRVASLEPMAGVAHGTQLPGRGALEGETPGGYQALPRAEAQCRAALHRLGVRFAEVAPVQRGRSCGIAHPVKVLALAGDVKISPAAVLNCPAAARLSQWVEGAVKPAALSALGTRPSTLLASSSYRCSRVAGTNRISQHASGSALDLRGFVFADGRRFVVEKKGMFSFGEKRFQRAIRTAGCRYFGTVLGPGYNWDHRNHLHLDIRPRRRVVCR
ncbi:extensin family protein [Aurantimonas sp. VKM B-3413]|uniref:extensin-like domain-containing protein n=1 Tax=Aurantimonas sp. VKM B-3413 TaxID=2779401 RepID=UPI001E51DC66|nr:extensin family protein [Aurantimonas sp. VKM B-3413]MCB8836500.1 extensin family protein [Aurantimonas sp. VKM B-3413]